MWAVLSAISWSLFYVPSVAMSAEQDARDVWINDLAMCESHLNPKVVVLDSNNKYSYGILQFQMSTWLSYGKPFGATAQNILDPVLQHEVARSMLDDGLEAKWKTCAGKVTAKYGAYPLNAPVIDSGDS